MISFIKILFIALFLGIANVSIAQVDTISIGFGASEGVTISTSSSESNNEDVTLNQIGLLPNENAASRFLAQATLGYDYQDVIEVTNMGIEDWIEDQFATPKSFDLLDQAKIYHQFTIDSTSNPDARTSNRMWKYSWWQYLMTSNDDLRQRVALALSEIIVLSELSVFGNNGYALTQYYDILLNHSFGNYRDLLNDVTMNPAMGTYLTYLNNPKSDTVLNRFPDENYAREVMQLFTIGTVMLNNDGTVIIDNDSIPIPTYDNEDIAEFSKIFTGLTWSDRDDFNRSARNDTSYIEDMIMFNDYHESGTKELLNGFIVPDRNPVDGLADINDAIDNLFNHQNIAPFVCKALIQRLVTSNPSPAYIERVSTVFIDNGNGVRGDLKAVIKSILLDPIAIDCASGDLVDFGMLREPFIRYVQMNKAFNASTLSGNFRNDMQYIYDYTSQRPLRSPSVFNFYQSDYQPIGAIEENGKVGPEFQITDAQTITGYINGIYRWVVSNNIADEYDIYSGEPNSNYTDEISEIDISTELLYTESDNLHILLDRLNMILAHGRISDYSINVIQNALLVLPITDLDDQNQLVRVAIYLILTAPEYLINR